MLGLYIPLFFFSQTYDSWKDKWLRFQETLPEFSWLQELRESLPDLSNTFAGGKYSFQDGNMKLEIHAMADTGEGPTASLIFGPKLKLKRPNSFFESGFIGMLNSLPIDELGSWCYRGWRDPKQFRRSRGGNHGNPVSGNHPCEQPLTGPVTLKEIQWNTYHLPYLSTLTTNRLEGTGPESAKIHSKN